MHKNAIMIGRFQPFHNSHLQVITKALEIADTLDVVVCGAKVAPSIRDPWSIEVRVNEMIAPALRDIKDRVNVHCISNHTYNQNKWIAKVQSIPSNVNDVCVVMCPKEHLHQLSRWKYVPLLERGVYASDVRKRYLTYDFSYESLVPEHVSEYMHTHSHSAEFERLHCEYHSLLEHNRSWAGAPHVPIFVTSDAVVTCCGHVLVVKRNAHPGLNLLSLPGARLNEKETTFDAAIRGVKTKVCDALASDIKRCHCVSNVFDDPNRSLLGRVITHVHYFDVGHLTLPKLPVDSNATWLSFNDVFKNEDKFFEDHFHIITHFLDRF